MMSFVFAQDDVVNGSLLLAPHSGICGLEIEGVFFAETQRVTSLLHVFLDDSPSRLYCKDAP